MRKALRASVAVFFGALMMLGIAACGGDYDCSDACNKIYKQCGLVVTVGGTPVSQSQCVQGCNAETDKGSILNCIEKASCDQNSMGLCLQ